MTAKSGPAAAVPSPQDVEVLIACFDWARFYAFSHRRDSHDVFETLDAFYKLSESVIHPAGGRIVKYLGDAGLAHFPAALADVGVMTMLELKRDADGWMRDQGIDSFLHVNCHFGAVTLGEIGGAETRRLDLIGDNVNLCFALEHKGFAITPQAFRRLSAVSRKHFKKYTPPILYRLAG
jgi:class 3 adenylate cyclase